MTRGVNALWRRLWSRGGGRVTAPDPATETPEHVPGRTHLVLDDGTVVEAPLDGEDRARTEYLARRVVAPPPPDA